MRHFKDYLKSAISPDTLLWLFPLVLCVPNVVLDITEYSHAAAKTTNLLLPAGVYMLLMGLSRNVGRSVLLFFPLMIYAAFQIVLLYLYGESIIAVDMFLNVVTTNVGEATELLGNLAIAIITVVLLYLPPLIWAVVLVCRSKRASENAVKKMRKWGAGTAAAGLCALAAAYCTVPRFSILRDIFPANVIHNMVTAIQRTEATQRYFETSTAFDFGARGTRDNDIREIYVLVIGETSRADNWQIFGYGRPTNPRLSLIEGMLAYPKTLSESNTTHKSVPLMLSPVTAMNFGDSIYTTKSIIGAFNQAGYRTAWLSNQSRNHSFIDFFAREAQLVDYIKDDGRHHFDHELLSSTSDVIETSPANKIFIVLHTYGSHFNYNERYPADFHIFTPDAASSASAENRPQLMNAYDNTIVYTDAMLADLIGLLDSLDCPAGVLYISDHGEDIFDDSRGRFLHASPVPTYHQLHVPLILWMSDELRTAYPQLYESALSHVGMDVSSSRSVFDTMLSMAGITTAYADPSKALTDSTYRNGKRVYLNDYNEAVPLKSAGLRKGDLDILSQKRISAE